MFWNMQGCERGGDRGYGVSILKPQICAKYWGFEMA